MGERKFEMLSYESADGIAFVTINRPERLNAINTAVLVELQHALARAQEDPAVGVIILTGSGEKAFVAGADIGQFVELDEEHGRAFALHGQQIFSALEESSKPVIAAVNGYALGGGCELALACHIRIASENARFGQPEASLGLIPGYGATQRLPRIIGKGRALELFLTGRQAGAQEALAMGLVSAVVPLAGLRDAAVETAKKILEKGPHAIARTIEAVNASDRLPLNDGLLFEAELFGTCCATPEQKEGVKAFHEKRRPEFRRT